MKWYLQIQICYTFDFEAMHQKNIEFLVCTRNERSVVTKADTCVWIQNLMLRVSIMYDFLKVYILRLRPQWLSPLFFG